MSSDNVNCIVCSSPCRLIGQGFRAPWIDELAHGRRDLTATQLLSCSKCGTCFFMPRMSDFEMEKLYGEYRENTYVNARRRWEPWYGNQVNSATIPDAPTVIDRVRFLDSLLEECGVEVLDVVVDLGGDLGQFFPARAKARYLIDPSQREVVQGVKRLRDWSEVECAPDLVIVAHVLEHVNDPRSLLAEVRLHIASEGHLYIEVPLDAPKLRSGHAGEFYASWLQWVAKSRWMFIAVDFVTGLFRNFGLHVPRLGLVKQSEHINYFTQESIEILLAQQGFSVTGSRSDPQFRMSGLLMGRLGVLARVSAPL